MINIKHGDKLSYKFVNNLSVNQRKLVTFILQEGFSLALVGGAVRDYILTGKLVNDLDFQIFLKNSKSLKQSDWINKVEDLTHKIKDKLNISMESLPFSIIRVYLDDSTLEFSSPRVENYSISKNSYSHSDFEFTLYSYLPYEKDFLRRDFSINAMAIEFQDGRDIIFIDPFDALSDLRAKILSPCNPDFVKDPVRFLRAIKFKQRLGFKYSRKLSNDFPKFNLEKLSSFYIFKEGINVGIISFLQELFYLIKKYKIKYSSGLGELLKLETIFDKLKDKENSISDQQDFLLAISNYNLKLDSIAKYLGLAQKDVLFYQRFFNHLNKYCTYNLKDILKFISSGSVEDIIYSDSFKLMAKLYGYFDKKGSEICQRVPKIYPNYRDKIKELENLFLVELKGRDKFNKLMNSNKFYPEQFSLLSVYCHLISIN